MMRLKKGFTLIELLTVIAVSSILLGIIVLALTRSFEMTRAAQAFADAQERARNLIDQISREVSNAANVRDTAGVGGRVNIVMPSDPDFDGTINGYVPVTLDYAKIDIMVPSAGEPIFGPNGALLNPDLLLDPNGDPNDPNNWREDPTLRAPKGQVSLPATEGLKMVRYWIGLNRPLNADNLTAARYTNPYDGLFGRRSGAKDNLYVLRRAEVEIRRLGPGGWQFNTELFRDVNGDGVVNSKDIDDPDFFNPDGTAGQANRINAWLRRSRVVTDISRFDMIQAIVDKNTGRVVYDGVIPRIQPLVQFTPNRVSSEPAQSGLAVRSGEETDNASKVGPEIFTTDFGGYSNLFVRLWPSSFRTPGTNNIAPASSIYEPWQSGRPYLVERNRIVANQVAGFSQYVLPFGGNEQSDGVEVFDVTEYLAAKDYDPSQPLPAGKPAWFRYPFTHAMVAADGRSGWLSNPAAREDFIPLVPDRKGGRVYASFGITEVGNGSVNFPVDEDNRPRVGAGADFLPGLDTTLTGASSPTRWQAAAYAPSSNTSTINQRFNVLWNDWAQIMAANGGSLDRTKDCHRFVDLRFLPTADGEPSPLNPQFGFARARIVPGSDVVFGPDQTKGANRGKAIRYTRTSDPNNVGPNQYFIQYVNQPEPDYTALGFTGVPANIGDPTFYDPNSFISSVLQPRFRAGYLKFNSSDTQPIPSGNIFVYYRFQFTEPNDVLAVDYDSRQKMNILLTIRNYPQTTLNFQPTVTVRGEAAVRNFVR